VREGAGVARTGAIRVVREGAGVARTGAIRVVREGAGVARTGAIRVVREGAGVARTGAIRFPQARVKRRPAVGETSSSSSMRLALGAPAIGSASPLSSAS
jgi:hypothetical protein